MSNTDDGGFADILGNIDKVKLDTKKKPEVSKADLKKIALESGFTQSTSPAIKASKKAAKPPAKKAVAPKKQSQPSIQKRTYSETKGTDQLNFRTKVSVAEEFRGVGQRQEPEWTLGYTLERAVAALKRELGED